MNPAVNSVAMGLLAVLAACASGEPQQIAHDSQAACQIQRVADLPVRFEQGAILVPAQLDHTAVQMQVDTGASSTMITPEAASALWLVPDHRHHTTVHGIGGEVVSDNTAVRSLIIGGKEWQALSLPTGHTARSWHAQPLVAGLLGANQLSVFDVELDVPNARMTLWDVRHCSGDFVRWEAPHYTVLLQRHSPNREVIDVQVDGHAVTALIDWGARSTVIKQGVAALLGVSADALSHDRSGVSHGADQHAVTTWLHQFDELRIGREVFHHPKLQVGELHLADVGMLLGADYVRTRHIWLSYATQQMFIALTRPVGVAREMPSGVSVATR